MIRRSCVDETLCVLPLRLAVSTPCVGVPDRPPAVEISCKVADPRDVDRARDHPYVDRPHVYHRPGCGMAGRICLCFHHRAGILHVLLAHLLAEVSIPSFRMALPLRAASTLCDPGLRVKTRRPCDCEKAYRISLCLLHALLAHLLGAVSILSFRMASPLRAASTLCVPVLLVKTHQPCGYD